MSPIFTRTMDITHIVREKLNIAQSDDALRDVFIEPSQ